jgi:predicted aspartyl protease
MKIEGSWPLCEDGAVRPVIYGEIQAADGSWKPSPFLVDTGADRTVLSAAILSTLNLPTCASEETIAGIGGAAVSVIVETTCRLLDENGGDVLFKGRFAAFTEISALDMSVLGRDVMNLFALIIDHQRDVVCLLGQRHSYTITVE